MPIDIRESDDGQMIKCTICPEHRHWIRRGGLSEHLQSRQHRGCIQQADNVAQHEAAVQRARDIDLREAATADLQYRAVMRSVDFESMSGQHSNMRQSAAEAEMWADYDMNGADFEVSEDKKAEDRRTYDQQEKVFGLWNAGFMANELGYEEDGKVVVSADSSNGEGDEILSEILANTCKVFFMTAHLN
jgi:hypothetical protein